MNTNKLAYPPIGIADVTLDSAEILALATTPIPIVKGAEGEVILPISCAVIYEPGTIDYTPAGAGDQLNFIYHGFGGVFPFQVAETGFIDGTMVGGGFGIDIPYYNGLTAASFSFVEGADIELTATANPTLGNGKLRVILVYQRVQFL